MQSITSLVWLLKQKVFCCGESQRKLCRPCFYDDTYKQESSQSLISLPGVEGLGIVQQTHCDLSAPESPALNEKKELMGD